MATEGGLAKLGTEGGLAKLGGPCNKASMVTLVSAMERVAAPRAWSSRRAASISCRSPERPSDTGDPDARDGAVLVASDLLLDPLVIGLPM